MKKALFKLAMAMPVGLCLADSVTLVSGLDLGVYENPEGTEFSFVNQNGQPYEVTVSKSVTVKSMYPCGPCKNVTFDFMGNAVSLSAFATRGDGVDVTLKNGTLDLENSAFYATSEYGNCGDLRTLWDGVTVNCGHFGISRNSYDTVVEVTGGSVFTAKKDMALFSVASSESDRVVPATNCCLYVNGGSKLAGVGIYTDYMHGGTQDFDSNFRVEISGVGSEMSSSGYPVSLCVGRMNRDVEVRYLDGAKGAFNNHVEIGSLSTARNNALIVDGGAVVTVSDYISLGVAEGADGNRLEILDGATVDVGQHSVVNVGEGSSGNTMTISNAVFKGKGIVLGKGSASSNNALRVYGPQTQYTPSPTFFTGAGHHNRYVIGDRFAFGTYGTSDYRFADGTAGPSVGNRFEILGEARVDCDEFYIGVGKDQDSSEDCENSLHIGAGSVLNMADRLLLRGKRDVLVISNASVSAYNIYAAHSVGAEGTRVHLIGRDVVFSPLKNSGVFTFFGGGQRGEYIMDGTSLGLSDKAAYFSDSSTPCSTNNTVKLINGALFRASTVYVAYPYSGGRADSRNTLFVGADSILDVSGVSLSGEDNKMVVSNGLVICSSTSPLVLGDSSSGITIPISGNELVMQGENPRLVATNGTKRLVTLQNGSRIRFEISGNGYAQVPLQADVEVGHGCGISVVISEDVQKNMGESRRDFQLTGTVYLASSGRTEDEFLSEINVGLPRRCTVSFRDRKLWVSVRKPMFSVIVR